MCDPDDVFTYELPLCVNGVTSSGWECTGHAHVSGEHIRCTDPSHTLNANESGVINIPPTGLILPTALILPTDLNNLGPALYGDLTGQTWTCSAK